MATTWFAKFVLFFQPEDSSRPADEKQLHVPAFRPVNKKTSTPLKALIWTMISIMAGLIIGQLF